MDTRPKLLNLTWTALVLTSLLTLAAARAAEPATATRPNSDASTAAERHSSTAGAKSTGATAKLDLNRATLEELETLPGVGPATAREIIKARPFKSVNELTNVTGIGSAKFATLKPRVTVKSTSTAVGKAPRNESASGSSSGTRVNDERETTGSSTHATTRERGSSTSSAARSSSVTGQKVNLNTATREQLEALPGIGPVKAQAIIDARPFNSIEDVMKVKGIKEGTFSEIRDQITVK